MLHVAEEGLETAGSAHTQEDGDTDSMGQSDRARQRAFGRLDTYLDENGGIKDPTKAGQAASQHSWPSRSPLSAHRHSAVNICTLQGALLLRP